MAKASSLTPIFRIRRSKLTSELFEIIRVVCSLCGTIIDLLHKSGFEFEFQIVDGSNQIKTE